MELPRFVVEAHEPRPMLHPSMSLRYRKRIHGRYDALQGENEARRVEVADTLWTLVDQITQTPA